MSQIVHRIKITGEIFYNVRNVESCACRSFEISDEFNVSAFESIKLCVAQKFLTLMDLNDYEIKMKGGE